MNIGRVAKLADVAADTIRFYERIGLLPRAERSLSGYRTYSPADVSRLRFIRRARTLGFSLDDISALLLLDAGGGDQVTLEASISRLLRDIELKLGELACLRDLLNARAKHPPGRPFPVIEALLTSEEHAP